MEITPRQFAQLVHQLKGSSRFGGAGDQRRAARVEQQSRITIVPLADGRPQADELVLVKNVSARGLGFVRAQKMKAGSEFLLRLPRQGGQAEELRCTVVRCEAVQKGVYLIGAEFVSAAAAASTGVAERVSDSKVA
jgi:hypothetical protein